MKHIWKKATAVTMVLIFVLSMICTAADVEKVFGDNPLMISAEAETTTYYSELGVFCARENGYDTHNDSLASSLGFKLGPVYNFNAYTSSSPRIALGYKTTTNWQEAIKNVIIVARDTPLDSTNNTDTVSYGGRTYHRVGCYTESQGYVAFTDSYGNLDCGTNSSKYVYLYYTREGASDNNKAIVDFFTQTTSSTSTTNAAVIRNTGGNSQSLENAGNKSHNLYLFAKYYEPTITAAPTAKTLTYNGSAQNLVNAGSATGGGVLSYTTTGKNADNYVLTIPAKTNAGTYTVWYRLVGSNTNTAGSVNVTINKAGNTVTFESPQTVTKTYSASSAQTATLKAATNAQGTLSYAINSQKTESGTAVSYFTLSGTTLTIANGTPAGKYTVVVQVTASGNDNYNSKTTHSDVTVTINRASISPTVTMSGWTYGETASSPSVSGNPGGGTVTYKYKVQGAADSTYTTTKPSNAGNYTVQATVGQTTNYQSGTATTNFTIAQDTISPSVTLQGWTYGSTPNTPVVSGNKGNGTETFYYKDKNAGDTAYTTTVPTEGGEYTIKVTIAATTNYYSGAATSTFTISPANLTPTVTMNDWAYGSTPSDPSVTGNSGNGSVTYSYKVKDADDSTYTSEKPTEIGNYTVRAVIGETTNYNGAAVTDDFEITKGILNPLVSLDGWTYGDTPNTPTVTGNTGNGQVVYQYSVQGANNYSGEIPINAGSYTVKAIISESEKYFGGEATCDFTIAPADSSATAPAPIEGLVYNGNEQTLVTAGTAQGGEMQYSLDGITYSPTLPAGINAGEYTVYYKVIGDPNHNDTAPAAVTVTISPAAAQGNTKPSLVNFTLDGIIGANFYYPSDLDSRITKIQYNITNSTAGDQTETINIDRNNTADVNGTTYLKVTCPITIDKLYGGKITATGQDDNKNVLGQSRTLNIDKYVAAVNSGSYEDSMKAVVTTMQQYSRYAQEYTQKPETLTALSSLNSDKTAITQAASKRVYISSQLILGEAVTMRIYVGDSEPTVSDTAAYFKKEYTLSTGSNGNGYYIDVENVPAFAMLHGFKLDYTVGGESQSITYYPITYLAQLVDVSQGFDEYTQNLACALYEYAVAVDAQFFSENAA